MFKYKVFFFILFLAFFLVSKGYCQQPSFVSNDQQVKTIAGTITYVDIAAGVLGVQTKNGTMVFHISVESDLLRYAHHMASIEILKGDPVIIQYAKNSHGKNTIVKLVDKQPDSF